VCVEIGELQEIYYISPLPVGATDIVKISKRRGNRGYIVAREMVLILD